MPVDPRLATNPALAHLSVAVSRALHRGNPRMEGEALVYAMLAINELRKQPGVMDAAELIMEEAQLLKESRCPA